MRASAGAITAVAYLLPTKASNGESGYNFGVKYLDALSHMPDGQYRHVIPVSSNDNSTVMAIDPFEWVA